MRRVARRQERDRLETEQLVEFMRRAQVPVVNRVEHPAEDANKNPGAILVTVSLIAESC